MKATIKITQKIATIESVWNQFLPAQHHLQATHLQAFENAQINNVETNYLQVFLKEKLIGLVYLQQFQFGHQHVSFNIQQTFLLKLLQIILPKHLPILVCGNLFRINFQGFYFKNPAQQPLVFEAIELFLQQQKKYKPCGVIVKDCAAVFVAQNNNVFGYHFFNGDVTMEVTRRAHWHTFDDYLKDLTKKYLQRAKKTIQSFKNIEQKELQASDIIAQAHKIEELYWNVVNKQSIKLGTVNTKYFFELKNNLQHNFEFYGLYKNNEMVAFYTLIFYNNEMETHYIGLNYEVNKINKLYFNILFLSVQKMIEKKYATLELGRTAKEAKTSLGAFPKQILNYIKVKNWMAKIAIHYFLKRFNKAENNQLQERSPLK